MLSRMPSLACASMARLGLQRDGMPHGAHRLLRLLLVIVLTAVLCGTQLQTPVRAEAATRFPITDAVTVVGSGTVAANGYASLQVSCPAGKIAMSGGVDVDDTINVVVQTTSPVYAGGGELYLQPDGNQPAPTGWQASVYNGDTAAGHNFKVAAVCARAPSAGSVVASTTVSYFSINMVQADCPVGTVALGGGVAVPPAGPGPGSGFNATVSALSPTFDATPNDLQAQPDGTSTAPIGWRSSVRSGADNDVTMKGGVTCAPLAGATTRVASVIIPRMTGGGTEAVCAAGLIALGGGVELDTIHNASLASSSPVFAGPLHRLMDQPNGLRPAPAGWYGNMLNYSVPIDVGTFKVGAVCAAPAFSLFLPLLAR